jgi:hypothetical protein
MTIICLSSGSRVRYRDDIVRALALPRGARLRFRYDEVYVAKATLQLAQEQPDKPPKCLLCFVENRADPSDPKAQGSIVPVRWAEARFEHAAGLLVLRLELGGWPDASVLPSAEKLEVEWPSADAAGRLSGLFCMGTKGALPTESDDLGDWRRLAEALGRLPSFAACPSFFQVEVLEDTDRLVAPRVEDGILVLNDSRRYQLRVRHYHPTETPSVVMSISVTGESSLAIGQPNIPLDSRHDVHQVLIRPKHVYSRCPATLMLMSPADGPEDGDEPDEERAERSLSLLLQFVVEPMVPLWLEVLVLAIGAGLGGAFAFFGDDILGDDATPGDVRFWAAVIFASTAVLHAVVTVLERRRAA